MPAREPFRSEQSSQPSHDAFQRLAEPLRREIKLHCYRMLGSLHEAADAVDGRLQTASQPDVAQRQLLGRYLEAWEGHDLDGFVALLREDATAVMPPWLQWYAGRKAIRNFFAMAWKTYGAFA